MMGRMHRIVKSKGKMLFLALVVAGLLTVIFSFVLSMQDIQQAVPIEPPGILFDTKLQKMEGKAWLPLLTLVISLLIAPGIGRAFRDQTGKTESL